jgi:alpha-beta hydrolase superfamily lysophospholipase
VLLVGTDDTDPVSDAAVTEHFAEALQAEDFAVDVVVVHGANHDNIVDPDTEAGRATLDVLRDVVSDLR